MLKKLIISLTIAINVVAYGYATYILNSPEEVPVLNVASIDQIVVVQAKTASALNARISENPTTVYYYCDENDADCQYVNDQILPIVADDLNVTFISEIEYVDVSALDVETASRRKSLYGFSSYPAFVIYDTTNDEFIPVASLEFNKNAPLTATELEAWLKENTSLNFK